MPELTPEKLILLAFVIVPGFMAVATYALKSPTQQRDWSKSLFELISYSAIILAAWSPWLEHFLDKPYAEINKRELLRAFFAVCVATPVLLSLTWYWLRVRILHRYAGFDHPIPRGWEFFVRNTKAYWVLFRLKSGQKLGGLFGKDSFAATYPHELDVYVQEIWSVDQATGVFLNRIDGTLGGVVRLSECETLEFFEITGKGADEQPKQQAADGPTTTGGTGGPSAQAPEGTNGQAVSPIAPAAT